MQPILANQYSVYFNNSCYSFLNDLLSNNSYSKIFILVDENTNSFCLPNFIANIATEIGIEIIEIEAGETNKNIETCLHLWNALTDLKADRKSILINLGGGVVTDIGGFVASTFKRGIAFINVPTTLLAMVDASIGGKNGVDLGSLKNQIGTINNPVSVLIDTSFLETLSKKEMKSGLAEMLKHGLIFDELYWEKFLDLSKLTTEDLDLLIHESVVIKNNIVLQDPTENGIRKALNFGHTLGHAIESYCLENNQKESLLHGEAIAIGMILESFLSLQLNLITENQYNNIKTNINSIFDKVDFTENDVNSILEYLIFDKKNEFGNVLFSLLNGIGKTQINQTVDNQLIFKAFNDYSK